MMRRRPTRADVGRALRETAEQWRPPDVSAPSRRGIGPGAKGTTEDAEQSNADLDARPVRAGIREYRALRIAAALAERRTWRRGRR